MSQIIPNKFLAWIQDNESLKCKVYVKGSVPKKTRVKSFDTTKPDHKNPKDCLKIGCLMIEFNDIEGPYPVWDTKTKTPYVAID
jgi:hypothetical protein